LLRQNGQIKKAMFEPGDDLGVHAAVMLLGDVGNAVAHALGQPYNELVCGAAGVVLSSSFHRATMIACLK